jgi:uncharacterized membrane protein YhaH (DUF805 family)
MGPIDAIKTGFAKSFHFKGRSSRSEFWWFAAAIIALVALCGTVLGPLENTFTMIRTKSAIFLGLALLLVPIGIRRFRDANPPESIWSFLRLVAVGTCIGLIVALGWLVGAPTNLAGSAAEIRDAMRPFAVFLFSLSFTCFFFLPTVSLIVNLSRPSSSHANEVPQ